MSGPLLLLPHQRQRTMRSTTIALRSAHLSLARPLSLCPGVARVGLNSNQARQSAQRRGIQHSASRRSAEDVRSATTTAQPAPARAGHAIDPSSILATYSAPLAKTFFRLKFFSLGSLSAAIILTPALLLAPAEVGWAGRVGLCVTALATSSASTAIFAWIGKPYVGVMRLLDAQTAQKVRQDDVADTGLSAASELPEVAQDEAKPAMQLLTTDWRLRALRTTIYEPGLIRPTRRPLATWELTLSPPALPAQKGPTDEHYPITKLVASTRLEKTGKLVGRLWATWPQKDALGRCTEEGQVIRHYSVHEDQLGDDWRVL